MPQFRPKREQLGQESRLPIPMGNAPIYVCQRCTHYWLVRHDRPLPDRCPQCGSPYWRAPAPGRVSKLDDALGQPTEPIYAYDIRTGVNRIVDVGWLLSSLSEPGERFSVTLRRSGMVFTEHQRQSENSSNYESQWHGSGRRAEAWLREREHHLATAVWVAAVARFPPLVDIVFGNMFAASTDEITCKKCGAAAQRHATLSGGGAYKPGDTFDTSTYPHYFCFACGRAWKVVNGELLPDPVTGVNLSRCQAPGCSADMLFPARRAGSGEYLLVCEDGHEHLVVEHARDRLALKLRER